MNQIQIQMECIFRLYCKEKLTFNQKILQTSKQMRILNFAADETFLLLISSIQDK